MSFSLYMRRLKDLLFVESAADGNRQSRSLHSAESTGFLYSYLIFSAFALAYFWYYLPQGFSIFDDAYLAGLGQRIANGQHIYTDFYYLRTPLSPLIQSIWIRALGDNYTVLVSRIIWAVQLYTTIVIFSLVYRKWLYAVTLTVTLCATLVYSSLLFAFPWYTYDGMFFTALFVFCVFRRRMILAGMFAALAFLCKQGFIALLPLYLLFELLNAGITRQGFRRRLRDVLLSVGAFVTVTVLAVTLLGASFPQIWRNVFTLPQRINDLPLTFLMYQDLPETVRVAWLPALALFVILIAPLKSAVKAIALGLWLIVVWSGLTQTADILPRTVTLVTFATLALFILRNWKTLRRSEVEEEISLALQVAALALVTLYTAGFNYNGWIFSYIGGALSLPVLIVFATDVSVDRRDTTLSAVTVSLALLTPALFVHHQFPYKSSPRAELTVPFTASRLAGLQADSSTVANLDSLTACVEGMTPANATLLAFPDPASLNYLTGRRAWGPIQWYYPREFDSALAQEVMDSLYSSPPDLVVLDDPWHISETPRFDMLYHAIYEIFAPVDSVGPFHILVPDCREDGDESDER